MHAALRDHLAVEMRQLLDQPDILQQSRAARAGGHGIEIIGNRGAVGMGQMRRLGAVGHDGVPSVGFLEAASVAGAGRMRRCCMARNQTKGSRPYIKVWLVATPQMALALIQSDPPKK